MRTRSSSTSASRSEYARTMSQRVACLPGDCIGPEVMAVAQRVLGVLAADVTLEDHLFGADAIRQTGDSLPPETLEACRSADAVLRAPIGHPDFADASAFRRPKMC